MAPTNRAKKTMKNKKNNGNGGVRRRRNGNGQPTPITRSIPRNPLLPTGVSNQATMPTASQTYTVSGEEVVAVINVPAGTDPGYIAFNQIISPDSCARLGGLSKLWQRIRWMKLHLRLVALNGSLVTSGYTMGFLEDPEITVPSAGSGIIPFLTAMRATTVRQNWVESTSGNILSVSELPEMYTQQGQDIRRFSPGRLVVALAGSVGADAPATFQIMMQYTVCLKLPFVAAAIENPSQVDYTIQNPVLYGETRETGDTPAPPTGPTLPTRPGRYNIIAPSLPGTGYAQVMLATKASIEASTGAELVGLQNYNVTGFERLVTALSWRDIGYYVTSQTLPLYPLYIHNVADPANSLYWPDERTPPIPTNANQAIFMPGTDFSYVFP